MSIKYKDNDTWVEAPNTLNIIQKTDIPEEAFNITGNCQYKFYRGGWDWFIREYGNKITTIDINSCEYMFGNSNIEEIPFEINFYNYGDYKNSGIHIKYMFANSYYLKSVPKFNNCQVGDRNYLFSNCYRLRTIPEDFANGFNWNFLDSTTNSYSGYTESMFQGCYSLRSIPMDFLAHSNTNIGCYYAYFYYGFSNCCSLDELIGLPIPYTAIWTSNAFYDTFRNCNRLKNVTFALDPATNTPYVKKWKSQTIDLSGYVGYASGNISSIMDYNSGITRDKEVKDDTTYQALKNDPDWFTTKIEYSRYNHDSAVATINSLPDTSAYLATAGGTNTIKFTGASGSATDGGAINTLTEEEIAVATAKGWTVTIV